MASAREIEEFVKACKAPIDRMFANFKDAGLRRQFARDNERRELRKRLENDVYSLLASGKPLRGDPAGWAAGLLYWIVNDDDRIPCGVPGISNADLEKCFGVSMSTIRRRAAQVPDMVKH